MPGGAGGQGAGFHRGGGTQREGQASPQPAAPKSMRGARAGGLCCGVGGFAAGWGPKGPSPPEGSGGALPRPGTPSLGRSGGAVLEAAEGADGGAEKAAEPGGELGAAGTPARPAGGAQWCPSRGARAGGLRAVLYQGPLPLPREEELDLLEEERGPDCDEVAGTLAPQIPPCPTAGGSLSLWWWSLSRWGQAGGHMGGTEQVSPPGR